MILSRIEGGFAKKEKKKEKKKGGGEEIRARSRPVDHGSHESGTAWQTKEVFERRVPHLFKPTDWNGKGHGGVGWLVGSLPDSRKGLDPYPSYDQKPDNI